MRQDPDTSRFTHYVPRGVLLRCLEHGAPDGATSDPSEGALLFVDISGFTGLTERFAERGAEGAEALTCALNDLFGRLIARVADHGGDVLKFAGDAVLAVFTTGPAGLGEAVRRAEHAAEALLADLAGFEGAPGLPLSLRVSIGAGDLHVAHLGGVRDRWEYVASGPALTQAAQLQARVPPGAVALSSEARAAREDALDPDIPAPVPAPARQVSQPEAVADALRRYVPGAIRARLDAGQRGWLAELRRVTVVFARMEGFEELLSRDLGAAQGVINAAQEALYRFEGSLNKVLVDDKGATLLAAFGLPPLAHADDPRRALAAAELLHDRLAGLGIGCTVGLSTGLTFCGIVGGETRREYTVMGHTVNLAARLMGAAGDGVWCDEATLRAGAGREAPGPSVTLKLKGLGEVHAFRARSVVRGPDSRGVAATREASPSEVGAAPDAPEGAPRRRGQRDTLRAQVDGLTRGVGGVVLVSGEAGLGKSRLTGALRAEAASQGVRVVAGAADAVDRATPYHVWGAALAQLIGEVEEEPQAPRQERLFHRLGPRRAALAPLLNGMLALGLPETPLTAGMSGAVRASNIHTLVAELLAEEVARGPLLVVLEDVHWADSASWALAAHVVAHVRPLLLVMTARPLEGDLPQEASRLLSLPGLVHLQLSPWERADVEALARQRLGVADVPRALVDLLLERAEGNPFFTDELLRVLGEEGLVVRVGERCVLAPAVGDLRGVAVPDTLQGLITSRIDRLTPSQQLALKVASVIGRVFSHRTLADIHPVPEDRPHLLGLLEALGRLDLTPLLGREPDPTYTFKHIITQEVAYNLMLFAQRRLLHRAVAEWYEARGTDLGPWYAALAHHWAAAEEPARALTYLDRAGAQALACGAYREAVGFLTEAERTAAAMEAAGRGASEGRAAARRGRQLGEALCGLGRLEESRRAFQRALVALGLTLPASMPGVVVYLLGQMAIQALHRLAPGRLARRPERDPERLLEGAHVFGKLTETYYVDNQKERTLLCVLSGLNLAERYGPCAEIARSCANSAVASGSVGAHRLAEVYARRAWEAAQEVDDPATRTWAALLVGMYDVSVGRFERAELLLTEAISVSRRLGDWRRWDESTATFGILQLRRGEPARALPTFTELIRSASGREVAESLGWGLSGAIEAAAGCGAEDVWTPRLAELLAADPQLGDADRIQAFGTLSLGWRRAGRLDLALQAAQVAAQIIQRSSALVHYAVSGYVATAETFLEVWEQEPRGPGAEARRDAARRSTDALVRLCAAFPIGLPAAHRTRAWWMRLAGHPRRARRHLQRGLEACERLAMPLEAPQLAQEAARLDRTPLLAPIPAGPQAPARERPTPPSTRCQAVERSRSPRSGDTMSGQVADDQGPVAPSLGSGGTSGGPVRAEP